MFEQVDESLRRTLVTELGRTIGCPIFHPSQITFDPPRIAETVQDGEAYINLFLFDIRENAQLRNDGHRLVRRPEQGIAGRKRAMVRLDLAYLVTVYAADDVRAEHRLLSDTLAVFLRWPSLPEMYLMGDLKVSGDNLVTLRVSQTDQIALSDLASLWQALGGTIRPALHLTVTAPYDPFETHWSRTVREVAFSLHTSAMPDVASAERPPISIATRLSMVGIVVDQATENALAAVRIEVPDLPGVAVQTNDRGIFRILDLPTGTHRLVITHSGYRPLELPVQIAAPGNGPPEPITVGMHPESDMAPEQMAREEGGLFGRLRYADGRPAAYVNVRVGGRRTSTDRRGTFHVVTAEDADEVTAEVPGLGVIVLPSDQLLLPERTTPEEELPGMPPKSSPEVDSGI